MGVWGTMRTLGVIKISWSLEQVGETKPFRA